MGSVASVSVAKSVARVSNLLCRGLPVRRPHEFLRAPVIGRLAGWKPAIQQTGSATYTTVKSAQARSNRRGCDLYLPEIELFAKKIADGALGAGDPQQGQQANDQGLADRRKAVGQKREAATDDGRFYQNKHTTAFLLTKSKAKISQFCAKFYGIMRQKVISQLGGALSPKAPFPGRLGRSSRRGDPTRE